MSAPSLPARKRSDRSRNSQKNGPIRPATAIQELQKTAETFSEKLHEQEPLLRKTLQDDPVLQQVVTSNPELAQLLEPDTLKQLVSAVKSPDELQSFFEANPQLQDITKHRQTVLSLRQQLQTLRQQHVRNFIPQTSPQNLQAARQMLSQFMQVNPNMTVAQLRPQWPGQHPILQSNNQHSFSPAPSVHGPPPLPPSTHGPSHFSPNSSHTPLPVSTTTKMDPSAHSTLPPHSNDAGSTGEVQAGWQKQHDALGPASSTFTTTAATHGHTHQHNSRPQYTHAAGSSDFSTEEIQPGSHTHWPHSHGMPPGTVTDSFSSRGQHNAGEAVHVPNGWNDKSVRGGAAAAHHWHGGAPYPQSAHGASVAHGSRVAHGSYDSYSQYFSSTYQTGEAPQSVNDVDGDEGSGGKRLDPKLYYEQVQPSDWSPPPAESCLHLYSRAYLGPMDILFPPLWFALGALLSSMTVVPLWALLLLLPAAFVLGMEVLVVQGAGVPRKELALSKTVPSFVVSCEVVALLVAVTKMLPLMLYGGTWMAVQVLLLTASILLVMLLHWWAATSDPGFIDTGKDEQAAEGTGTDAAALQAPLNPRHIMPECWTCRIPRPLRSKHCSVCQRCVSRFDHHCNMLPNCVGAGNQATFAAFLFTILCSLLFFLKLTFQYSWLRFAALIEQANKDSKWPTWVLVLQSTSSNARDILLLQILFVPISAGLLFLASRCLLLILGNLTTNELLNRHRYMYLRHEVAGFCNRFDWGPVRNFWQYWGKQSGLDWWKLYEAGDKAMQNKNMTMVTTWSVTYYIRLWDLKYQQVTERLYKIREERRERRMQRAMMRMHEDMQ